MNDYANARISSRQFTILIVLGVIGDTILVVPTMAAAYAKQDAWLSMLLAFALGLATGGMYGMLANRLRGQSLVAGARQRLGAWFGGAAGLLVLFQFYMCILTLLNEMSQFMTTQMMPETPVNAIMILFLAVVIIAYRYGVEAFARMGEMLIPAFFALFVTLVVLLLPQVELPHLQPVAANGVLPIVQGAFPLYCAAFAEMLVIFMLVPHVEAKNGLLKPIFKGFAAGGVVIFIVMLLCVLVLGPNLMETKYYPTFVLAQKISVGDFLERLEAVLTFLWVITVFFKTLLLFYALTTGLSQLFRLKESRMLTIPLAMILLVSTVAVTPSITVYNDILLRYYFWFDLTFCVLLPALIWAALAIRRGK